jgi:hypothetical protein
VFVVCLLLVVNSDVLKLFAFRSHSVQGDGAVFAIGRDNNLTGDCDLYFSGLAAADRELAELPKLVSRRLDALCLSFVYCLS